MKDAPREDLIRMSTVIRAETDGDGMMTLTGIPILFNVWTEINSWEGKFRERISPKALKKTLKERGDQIKVLFNHGFDPQIGDKPLGKPTRQDVKDDGLHVEVPLAPTSYNRDIQALIEAEALDGMSFRFTVVKEEWENLDEDDGKLPERTITELRLHEYGPVTFPAYEATTVGVRSRDAYAELRRRQAAVDAALQDSETDPAPGESADTDPAPSQSVTQQISRLIRDIDLILRGVTE